MKKRLLILSVLMAVSMLVLAGCGSGELGVQVDGDKSAVITFQDASGDMSVAAGSLVVGENETLVIEPAFENEGEVQVQLHELELSEDADIEEIENAVAGSDPVLDLAVSGTEPIMVGIEPGDYVINAKTNRKATGEIRLRVEAK